MKKFSEIVTPFLLFVLGTYGRDIFEFLYTSILPIPGDLIVTISVIIAAIILMIISEK